MVFRVRVIAMTGLVTVHTLCRWPVDHSVAGSARAASYISSEWLKLVVANAEQFGILLVVLTRQSGICSMRTGRRTSGSGKLIWRSWRGSFMRQVRATQ